MNQYHGIPKGWHFFSRVFIVFLFLFTVSSVVFSYPAGRWPKGNGPHQMLFIFDDSYKKAHKQPYFVGAFNENGECDGTYSVGLLPMRDDGEGGDEVAGDHIWTLSYNVHPSDEKVSAIVFPDNSTINANHAIDIKSFLPQDGVCRLASIKPETVKIFANTHSDLDALYVSLNIDEKGFPIKDAHCAPIKMEMINDGLKDENLVVYQWFCLFPIMDKGEKYNFSFYTGPNKPPFFTGSNLFNKSNDAVFTLTVPQSVESADISRIGGGEAGDLDKAYGEIKGENRDEDKGEGLSGSTDILPQRILTSKGLMDFYEVIITFDDSYEKKYEQPWIIGQFDALGNWDSAYSIGLTPMWDDGENGDKAANDGIWTYKQNFLPTDKPVDILVFPDNSTLDSKKAIDIKSYLPTTSQWKLYANKGSYVTIRGKSTKQRSQLYLRGSWDESGLPLDGSLGKAIKMEPTLNDEGIHYGGFYQAATYLVFLDREYDIAFYEDPLSEPISVMKATFGASLELNLPVELAKLVPVKVIVDDSKKKSYDQLYIIGSWDKFGFYDDSYSIGLKPMEIASKDRYEEAGEGMWIHETHVAQDERAYSILIFDSTETINSKFAIDIKSFVARFDEPVTVTIVLPKIVPLGEQINSTMEGIQRDDIFIIIFFTALSVIIFIVFFFSIRSIFWPKQLSFNALLRDLKKKKLIFLASQDRELSEMVILTAIRNWLAEHSLVGGLFTSTMTLETVKEKISNLEGNDKWMKKWGENLLIHEGESFDYELIKEQVYKLSELDFVIIDSLEAYKTLVEIDGEKTGSELPQNIKEEKAEGKKPEKTKDKKEVGKGKKKGEKDIIEDKGEKSFDITVFTRDIQKFYREYNLPVLVLCQPRSLGIDSADLSKADKLPWFKENSHWISIVLLKKNDEKLYREDEMEMTQSQGIQSKKLLSNIKTGKSQEGF